MRDIQEDFSQKYDRYGSMIFKIAMTYMGNTADSEDVMQEVFMRLLYKSPNFNDSEHEKRWLIRTASNVCKDILKRFDRRYDIIRYDTGGYKVWSLREGEDTEPDIEIITKDSSKIPIHTFCYSSSIVDLKKDYDVGIILVGLKNPLIPITFRVSFLTAFIMNSAIKNQI